MENSQATIKWYEVEKTLVYARCDLRSIYARGYFAAMGELPDGISRDDLDAETRLAKGEFTERQLFFNGLLDVYNGLNYAWATRGFCMNIAEREGGIMFEVSTPTEGAFEALVPIAISEPRDVAKIADRPISLTPVRVALQVAFEKLTSICYRLSMLPGVSSPEKIECPKGLAEESHPISFDEEEFELRLAMVYSHVNEAWNSRFDKGVVSDPEEHRKRRLFPREVLPRGR